MKSRKLSRAEAQLWAQVAKTVKPLVRRVPSPAAEAATQHGAEVPTSSPAPAKSRAPRGIQHQPPAGSLVQKRQEPRRLDRHGLDAAWDKKLARAALHPDFTLDLHGHSLDAAHARLDHGLAQAAALGARLVLVITGLPRAAEAADRGQRRGAIRAKIMDWLDHGPHASRIAAVRPAHRRHGGAGALYLVMKKPR
ncbi:MAG: Smr/MutS family protein [Sphingomonadaceae bacterium]